MNHEAGDIVWYSLKNQSHPEVVKCIIDDVQDGIVNGEESCFYILQMHHDRNKQMRAPHGFNIFNSYENALEELEKYVEKLIKIKSED